MTTKYLIEENFIPFDRIKEVVERKWLIPSDDLKAALSVIFDVQDNNDKPGVHMTDVNGYINVNLYCVITSIVSNEIEYRDLFRNTIINMMKDK